MIRAVVFDMDGLMIDTERMGRKVWSQIGDEMGYPVSDALYQKVLGVNETSCRRVLTDAFGADFPCQAFRENTAQRMEFLLQTEGVPVKPGLRALLDYLKLHGYRIAVATSTSRAPALAHLAGAHVEKDFDAVICGDMITRGKPAPDIYLKACELLQTPPEQCMALEDSPNGIRSAHAGGLQAVMVPDLIAPTPELRAMLYACCDDLFGVIALLQTNPPPMSPKMK
ncbi:MAG: HAD family phosphatase [Clostridia bacterium]